MQICLLYKKYLLYMEKVDTNNQHICLVYKRKSKIDTQLVS